MAAKHTYVLHCDGPGTAGAGCDRAFAPVAEAPLKASTVRLAARQNGWRFRLEPRRSGESPAQPRDYCPTCVEAMAHN